MALRDEIIPYTDGNGYVSNGLVPAGTLKGSDNGIMYTSEYYMMLQKSGQLTAQDKIDFAQKIDKCIGTNDILNRVPMAQDDGQEGPDDYFALLSACVVLGNTDIPRRLLGAMVRHLGFMDNENAWGFNPSAFILRFPHLIACLISAAFPSLINPLHYLIRLANWHFYAYAAISLALGDMFTEINNSDSRLLSWHCWQGVKTTSILGWIGGKIWSKRLYKQYGSTGMQAVADIYFLDNHPFQKYWKTE